MAIYRNVSMSFWTDSKIADDFTVEDRYFYLYLFTNPHTNLCGCYEISTKQISWETGLSVAKVKNLIKRMCETHNVIRYCEETKELLILNWHKYNWTSSEKFRKPLSKEILNVKSTLFRDYLTDVFNGNDTVSIGYLYPTDTTVTVSVTDTVPVTVSDTVPDTVTESIKEIVDYLNEVTGKHYTYTGKDTVKNIKARLADKFTVEDFKTVIYKKTKQWANDPKMCKFLRPETLFSNKFESYLNENEALSAVERWDLA